MRDAGGVLPHVALISTPPYLYGLKRALSLGYEVTPQS